MSGIKLKDTDKIYTKFGVLRGKGGNAQKGRQSLVFTDFLHNPLHSYCIINKETTKHYEDFIWIIAHSTLNDIHL